MNWNDAVSVVAHWKCLEGFKPVFVIIQKKKVGIILYFLFPTNPIKNKSNHPEFVSLLSLSDFPALCLKPICPY